MKKYSKIALFKSKGRIFKESLSKYRSPFQRDRDRIIHSASFRRLKHKTQVFVNTEGDHFRTRITLATNLKQRTHDKPDEIVVFLDRASKILTIKIFGLDGSDFGGDFRN